MTKTLKKYLLISLGSIFVLLGILGVFLPLVPTTPFLLVAVACYANSSPQLHRKLLNNRYFGSTLKQWEENKSISRSAKIKAMSLIAVTFAISIGVLHQKILLQAGLTVLGICLLIYMWRLKESSPEQVNS